LLLCCTVRSQAYLVCLTYQPRKNFLQCDTNWFSHPLQRKAPDENCQELLPVTSDWRITPLVRRSQCICQNASECLGIGGSQTQFESQTICELATKPCHVQSGLLYVVMLKLLLFGHGFAIMHTRFCDSGLDCLLACSLQALQKPLYSQSCTAADFRCCAFLSSQETGSQHQHTLSQLSLGLECFPWHGL